MPSGDELLRAKAGKVFRRKSAASPAILHSLLKQAEKGVKVLRPNSAASQKIQA